MSDNISGLNKDLTERLLGRLWQPGVARLHMAEAIMDRLEKMVGPLPLTVDLEQRWQSVLDAQEDQPPLVYAQPVPEADPVSELDGHRQMAGPQPSATSPVVASAAPPKKMLKPDLVVDSGKREAPPVTRPEKSLNFPPSIAPSLPQPDKTTRPPANRIEKSAKPSPPAESPPHPKTGSPDKAPVALSAVVAPISNVTQKAITPVPVVAAMPQKTAAPAIVTVENSQPERVVVAPKAADAVRPKAETKARNGRQPLVKPSRTKAGPGQKLSRAATASRSTKPQLPLVRPHSPAPKTAVSFPPAPMLPAAVPATPTGLPVVQPIEARLGQAPRDLPLPASASVQATQTPGMTSGPAKPRVSPVPAKPAPVSNVIQRQTDPAAAKNSAADSTPAGVDVDEIVEEVQRQFMRQLAIEGERRGVTSWQ